MNSSGQKNTFEWPRVVSQVIFVQCHNLHKSQLRYNLDRWYGAVAEHPNMPYRDTDFLAAEYRVGKKVTTQRC